MISALGRQGQEDQAIRDCTEVWKQLGLQKSPLKEKDLHGLALNVITCVVAKEAICAL